MSIKFGTEGWRAIMAEQFTADNVRVVTQAIAEHLLEQGGRAGAPAAIAVGHDTRFLSPYFARAVAEVLAGNGLRSWLTDRAIPTCAVSRYVVAKRLPAGIMITASHNPPEYNGIKIKEAFGGSATGETVASVERRIGVHPVKRLALEDAQAQGLVQPAGDFLPRYLKGITAFIDVKAIRRAKLRVMVDSMHGAGGRIIEQVVKGGACRVETMHADPDARFGGHAPEPIATHLTELIAVMKRPGIDLGIANDGDADRIGIIGPKGRWLNPGQVMCLLLMHLITQRQAKGAVVKTVSNTMMINRVADALGLKLIEVPVGFKLIAKLMQEQDIVIGGEESGGIGLQGYLPERDGVVNGLLLMETLAVRRRTLPALMSELERRFGRWHYGRRDLHLKMPQVDALFARLKASTPERMAGVPVASVNTLDGVKLIGRDDSWLLFRRSGTEPIVRIYAETPQAGRLPALLDFGVGLVNT